MAELGSLADFVTLDFMNVNLNIQTPKGTFGVFTNQLRSGEYAASVMYQPGLPEDVDETIGHHVEHGQTEEQALASLRRWCDETFGKPCEIR